VTCFSVYVDAKGTFKPISVFDKHLDLGPNFVHRLVVDARAVVGKDHL